MFCIDSEGANLEDARGRFSIEALASILPTSWIRDALESCGKQDQRTRSLPATATVWLVILLGLFRRLSYKDVLAKIHKTWWTVNLWSAKAPPTDSSLTKARDRVGKTPLKLLFDRSAGTWVNGVAGLIVNGRRVMALDGLTYKVDDAEANRAFFGLPGCSRGHSAFPQLRAVHLLDVGSRMVRDVEYGPYARGEITLARELWPRIPVGTLLLLDRNFVLFDLLWRLHGSQASDFIVRAKKGIKLRVVQELSAGDEIVEIDVPAAARRREPLLPRRWRLRRVTAQLEDTGEQLVLLTTLLDLNTSTKDDIVNCYLTRWEIETSNGEIKTHFCGCATVNRPVPLRSKNPDRLIQELYGLLVAYNAVRRLMCTAAVKRKLDPTRFSFVSAAERVREAVHHMGRLPTSQLLSRHQELCEAIARAVVQERKGRHVPRKVKVKMSKYPVRKPTAVA